MAVNLSGSVNPNGVEIAAGVALFVSLSALVRGLVTRGTLVLAGIAAAIMITVRPPLGPVLFVVDVAAVALVAGRGRVAALARRRDVRRILGGLTVLGVLVTGVWTLTSGGPETKPVAGRGRTGDIMAQILDSRIRFYVHQIVGQFGYGETTMSRYAIYLWYLLVLVVVVPALVWGAWRLRLVLAGLVAVSLVFLVALDRYFAPRNGWFAQGRYMLPVLAGVLVLAAVSGRGPAGRAVSGRGPARWASVAGTRWEAVAGSPCCRSRW